MKKRIVFLLLITVTALGFAAGQDVDLYEALYNEASSYSAQLDILKKTVEAQPSDAAEFYARALEKLVASHRNIKKINSKERKAADDQAMFLASLLGKEKYAAAAPDLWRIKDEFTTAPLAQAEALKALGMVGATEYLPRVIRVLESLNVAPTSNRLYGEQVATGAIIALENYQDPSGYLPVFFASVGWYSKEVKDQAVKSLPLIADDPSSYMDGVIKGPAYNYPTKCAALKIIEAAKLDSNLKVGMAVEALDQGWKGSSIDAKQGTTFAADMRKLAIQMIYKYKTDNEAIYPLLDKSYIEGETQEKLYAVAALASQGTAEGAKQLSKYLKELNDKCFHNTIKQGDEQMVRAIIPALGQTGRSEAKSALTAVATSNWTPAVMKLADDALKQLES